MKMKLTQRASRLLPCLLLAAGLASAFTGCKKKDMSMKMNEPRNIHGVANFGQTFGDLNQKQLNVAQAIGITPITSREDAEEMTDQLTFIEQRPLCRRLTHPLHPLPDTRRRCPAGYHRTEFPRLARFQGAQPQPYHRHFRPTHGERREAPATPQLQCLQQLHPCLRHNIRRQLEALPKSGGRGRTPHARCRCRHTEAGARRSIRDLKQADRCYVKYEMSRAVSTSLHGNNVCNAIFIRHG